MDNDKKLVSTAINDFMNTINAAYIYFEIESVNFESSPYPFYMWLEDLRQEMADVSSNIWKIFYGNIKEV